MTIHRMGKNVSAPAIRGWRTRRRNLYLHRKMIEKRKLLARIFLFWTPLTMVFMVGMINKSSDDLLREFPIMYKKSEAMEMRDRKIDFLYVAEFADKYGVDPFLYWDLLKCENPALDPKAQSNVMQEYGRELSFGLVQIHLPDNPTITKEQATDPEFALDWGAQELAKKHYWRWANCMKKI